MLTLAELLERMEEEDELTLLERLGITPTELLDRCIDIVEDKYEELLEIYDDTEQEEF